MFEYWKAHPWQRRITTATITALVAMVTVAVMLPSIRTHMVLRKLGTDDPATRSAAMQWGIELAASDERVVNILQNSLEDEDDLRFAGIVTILRAVGRFDPPPNADIHDRLHWVALSTSSPSAHASRRLFLHDMIRGGRDNVHVRRGLNLAAKDDAPYVREASAILAARLKDWAVLSDLSNDRDARVRGSAALAAGFAGAQILAPTLAGQLHSEQDPQALANLRHALVLLDAPGSANILGNAATTAWIQRDEQALDQAMHSLVMIGGCRAEDVVTLIVEDCSRNNEPAPPSVISAAGRLKIHSAEPAIRKVLHDALAGDERIKQAHIIAAIESAEALEISIGPEVLKICKHLEGPENILVLVKALRSLGRHMSSPEMSPDECRQVLRQWSLHRPDEDNHTAMSLISAASAVALWLAEPSEGFMRDMDQQDSLLIMNINRDASAFYVYAALQGASSLSADYISWHIGRSGLKEAFGLGMSLVPEPDDPRTDAHSKQPRIYGEYVMQAGAMMIALSAQDDVREAALTRLMARATGGYVGIRPAWPDLHTYDCALALLGQAEYVPRVRELLTSGTFPVRRAVATLSLTGDRWGLDWLLGDAQSTPSQVAWLMRNTTTGEVLREVATQVPSIDDWASENLRLWQAKLAQDYYFINREKIRLDPAR